MGRQLVEGLPPSRLPLQAARAQFCRGSLGASIKSIAGLSSTKGHLEPLPHRYPTQGHTYTLTSASHWLSGYALEDIHSLVFLACCMLRWAQVPRESLQAGGKCMAGHHRSKA